MEALEVPDPAWHGSRGWRIMVAIPHGEPAPGDLGQHRRRSRRGMRTLFRLLWISFREKEITRNRDP